MSILEEKDWSFEKFSGKHSDRADHLESAGTSDELIEVLKKEFYENLQNKIFRVGIDSLENHFDENRVIIQFKVKPENYDWFFNARTGYRAQFWISPENGTNFNQRLVTQLREIFLENIPQSIPARKIKVLKNGESDRDEVDVGKTYLSRDWVGRSLAPKFSKIWICEHLIRGNNLNSEKTFTSALSYKNPRLVVRKWNGSECGLVAAYPDEEYFWLDLKGAFVHKRTGELEQKKSPQKRAKELHNTGWT